MSLLSKLFGGGASAPEPTAENYKDFAITPKPQKEGSRWRVGALIEKDGKSHHLIRADVLEDRDAADVASIGKAKQMIDEQGERLFN